MIKKYLVRDFPKAQIIVDTYYKTANRVIKEVYPNSSVKFFIQIAKPRGRKRKKVENVKENISIGTTTLIAKQKT
jgi:hypothetical protein